MTQDMFAMTKKITDDITRSTFAEVYQHIAFCNGEIRLQAVRYGTGWYCLILLEEQDDDLVFEAFDDLLAGDNDFFEGRDFLRTHDRVVFVEDANDPLHAIYLAVVTAAFKIKKEKGED